MKVSELMVGNWINTEHGATQILAFEFSKIHSTQGVYYYRQDCKGIPLTNDVLVDNLGFDGNPYNDTYSYNGFVIDAIFVIHKGVCYFFKGKEIKHVHTLQNVYYFDKLTGEKLIFKI